MAEYVKNKCKTKGGNMFWKVHGVRPISDKVKDDQGTIVPYDIGHILNESQTISTVSIHFSIM